MLVRRAVRTLAAVPSRRVLAIAGFGFCLTAYGLIEWGGAWAVGAVIEVLCSRYLAILAATSPSLAGEVIGR